MPVLARSAVLMSLLLQDNAVDLELATCVVALDPGLAFGVLQLANPACDRPGDPVWQIPLALVAAGREALQNLLEYAPRITLSALEGERGQLLQLARGAVVRACVAQLLARELGRCNPKKSFLGGLVFEVPQMVGLTAAVRGDYRARLLSVMCNSLPAAVVKAALADMDEAEGVNDPLLATILIAEALIQAATPASRSPIAASGSWRCWPDLVQEQRASLLKRCAELTDWVAANLYRLDPWDFMSRLERRKPGE